MNNKSDLDGSVSKGNWESLRQHEADIWRVSTRAPLSSGSTGQRQSRRWDDYIYPSQSRVAGSGANNCDWLVRWQRLPITLNASRVHPILSAQPVIDTKRGTSFSLAWRSEAESRCVVLEASDCKQLPSNYGCTVQKIEALEIKPGLLESFFLAVNFRVPAYEATHIEWSRFSKSITGIRLRSVRDQYWTLRVVT